MKNVLLTSQAIIFKQQEVVDKDLNYQDFPCELDVKKVTELYQCIHHFQCTLFPANIFVQVQQVLEFYCNCFTFLLAFSSLTRHHYMNHIHLPTMLVLIRIV